MENNNKSQYDWFKGPQAQKQDKDFKQRVKDGFKWAKIFSYVALFTFSMFGCVQVFTITTDNAIGQGLEIYHDEGDIAPAVSTITFGKGIVFGPDAEGNKDDEPTITSYLSTTSQVSSIWINNNDDPELLKEVHAFVETSQDVAMKDAYKGINSGIANRASDVSEFKYENEEGDEVTLPGDHTSAYEDLFMNSFQALNPEATAEDFNNTKLQATGNEEYLVYSSAATSFKDALAIDFATTPFYVPVQTSKDWDPALEIYKPTYETVTVQIDIDSFETRNEKNIARAGMAVDILNSYFGENFDTPLAEFLGSTNEAEALELANSTTYLDDWSDDSVFVNSTQFDRMAILSQILFAAGFEFSFDDMEYINDDGATKTDSDFDIVESIEYQEGKMVGFIGENTKFRPITTWGEAFSLGPFYGFFVYPIGYITSNLVSGMGNLSGWESMMTIFLVVFTIRMLTFALSYKSTMAQSRMQDLNGKKAIIEAKYTQYEGNKQMEMRKRQEVADLYKKNGINPMASLGTMFLTMPFFLAIWRVIGGIPHLKAASWLGITFSATSYQEFFAGQWQYLPLMLIAAGIQLLSQLYPRLINRKQNNERLNAAQKEAMKKANKTQNITMGVFVFMSVIFTAGIQIYWIIGGLWRIIEVRVTHHLKEKDKSKRVK